jgi:hypothetical protein
MLRRFFSQVSWLSSRLKRQLARPVLKYSVLAGGAGLWIVGFVDQLSSSAAAMKYLAMSALIAVVAML